MAERLLHVQTLGGRSRADADVAYDNQGQLSFSRRLSP